MYIYNFFISAETWFKGQKKNWDNTCLQTQVEAISCKNQTNHRIRLADQKVFNRFYNGDQV